MGHGTFPEINVGKGDVLWKAGGEKQALSIICAGYYMWTMCDGSKKKSVQSRANNLQADILDPTAGTVCHSLLLPSKQFHALIVSRLWYLMRCIWAVTQSVRKKKSCRNSALRFDCRTSFPTVPLLPVCPRSERERQRSMRRAMHEETQPLCCLYLFSGLCLYISDMTRVICGGGGGGGLPIWW